MDQDIVACWSNHKSDMHNKYNLLNSFYIKFANMYENIYFR